LQAVWRVALSSALIAHGIAIGSPQLQFLKWKAFQGDYADERRSIAGHLERRR
jgi:hypothetical protein